MDKQMEEIVNIPGSSEVFSFGAVTYANDYKIKFGVKRKTIEKYSVYSMETASEMSKSISDYTLSDYGIGITGKLMKKDNNNLYGADNAVYISIYDQKNNKFYNDKIFVGERERWSNKKIVLQKVCNMLIEIIGS